MSTSAAQTRTGWFRRHSQELLRGAILGLVAGIVICVLGWEPCPMPMNGDTEQQVVARWGPPDEVFERRGPQSPAGLLTLKRLVYRCGLFNTTAAVIYVDSRGVVIDVAHGRL